MKRTRAASHFWIWFQRYSTRYLLTNPAYQQASSILDEFASTHGEKLIKDPTKRAMLQRARCWWYARLGRFEEAIASFDRALAINPRHLAALNDRGNAFFRLGRFDEALGGYDQALRSLDGSMRELASALSDLRLAQKTLLVVLSTCGQTLMEGGSGGEDGLRIHSIHSGGADAERRGSRRDLSGGTGLYRQGHRIPIIFITAHPDETIRTRALDAGAVCFLGKPFDVQTLIERLHKAVNRQDCETT